jgi:hypothetical protein
MNDEKPQKTSRGARGAKRRTTNESAVTAAALGDQNSAERVVPVPQTSELNAQRSEPLGSAASTADAQAFDDTEAEIRRRAYELYLSRGGAHGDDVSDWLEAERSVRSRAGREAAHAENLLANQQNQEERR